VILLKLIAKFKGKLSEAQGHEWNENYISGKLNL